jgi:hypothetical protein
MKAWGMALGRVPRSEQARALWADGSVAQDDFGLRGADSTKPTTTRSTRSIPPTFFCQANSFACATKGMMAFLCSSL